MKSFNRLVLGALSSLLFAVGLNAAADRVDPMNRSDGLKNADSTMTSTPDCGAICSIVEK